MHKILQISDLHIQATPDGTLLGVVTEYYFQQVLQQAHQRHGRFDLILVSGDLAQTACIEAYQRIRATLEQYRSPYFCIAGNHDIPEIMHQIFPPQRSIALGDWRIIGLHSAVAGSPVGNIAEDELQALRNELKLHGDQATIIAVHHPCVACGSRWMDTMQIQNSEALWALLAKFPQVQALCCGHIHQQLHRHRQAVEVLAAPATCFQFLPNSEQFALDDARPGYRIIELTHQRLHSYCEYIEADDFVVNAAGQQGY
jgi:3',5'-cyclic-AMP phosphodiesterase